MNGCVGLLENIKVLNRFMMISEEERGNLCTVWERSERDENEDRQKQKTKTHTTHSDREREREREMYELKRHLKLALVCRPEGGRGN